MAKARRYPTCDAHDHGGANVKTRQLSLGGGQVLHLCRAGFTAEMAWRRRRNKTLTGKARFPIRKWS